jgi:hypothetical protein
MHPSEILHEVQQLYNVSDRLDSLAEQNPQRSEAVITISGRVRNAAIVLDGWRCWSRRKWRRSPDWIQPVPDLLIAVSEPCFLDCGAEASRGERHLEVNYELASRSRHSQRSPTF